jgi:hypothetical protein
VGVSNTAGTLYYFYIMNKCAIIFWGSLFIWCILISLFWIKVAKDSYNTISTPVEEMYHRQLVVTLDSILDARFGADCCEEDTDTVSANTFNTRFGGNLSPID